MKTITKRYFALLLVLAMVLTMLPVSAQAEECAHESKRSHGGVADYVPLDSSYHTVLYHHYYICNDCGAGVWGETTSSKEYHDMFYLDNFCMECGYRPGSTHTHDYKASSTETKREKLDDTYHNVVTTTYTACSCGSTGTSSVSTVKEAHTFGEAREVSAGNWQKTCTGCGATRKAEAPAQPGPSETTPPEKEPEETKPQETTPPVTTPTEPVPGETVPPETHVHEFLYGNSEAEHPHYSFGYCSCGVGNTKTNDQDICCQCSGNHIWGYPVRLPDGSFKQTCTTCEETQTTTPGANVELYYRVVDTITHRHNAAKVYQDVHDIDSSASAIWKTIAEQATDVLMDPDFVTTNETLNAIDSGVVGSIWDAVTEETWDEQQKEYWKTLLLKMLDSHYEDPAILAKEQDGLADGADAIAEALKLIETVTGEEMDRLNEKAAEYGTKLDVFTSSIHEYITTIEPDSSSQSSGEKDKIDLLMEELANRKATSKDRAEGKEHVNEWMENLGLLTKVIEAGVDSIGDATLNYRYNKTIIELGQNVENLDILNSILDTAKAYGNKNLENAASELIQDIEKDMVNALNFLTSAGIGIAEFFIKTGFEFAKEYIEERLEGTLETLFKETSKYLDFLSLGGTAMQAILGWGPAYDAAQQLMTINQMDATMNITKVLKDQDNPHMAELWGVLQTEGCTYAKEFLKKWDRATDLSVADFGIKDGTLSAVNRQLDIESKFYVNMLGLSVDTAE